MQLRVVCQFSSSSVNFDPNLASCYFPTFFLFSVTSSCHTDAIICYCHSNGSLETITVLCEYVCKCIKIKITFDSLFHMYTIFKFISFTAAAALHTKIIPLLICTHTIYIREPLNAHSAHSIIKHLN